MGSFLVVVVNPDITIGLQLLQREVELLAERNLVKLLGEDLALTLERYVFLYNQHLPQRALMHKTPIQALKE